MTKESSSVSSWLVSSTISVIFKSSSDLFVEFDFKLTISSSESWDISTMVSDHVFFIRSIVLPSEPGTIVLFCAYYNYIVDVSVWL